MLIFNINGYEDFQSLFGMEAHGNGVKSRKNKILLAHLKNPALIRYCREHDDWSLLHIRSMAELKQLVLERIRDNGKADPKLPNKVILIGNTYWSSQYRTDHMEGLCEDFERIVAEYHLMYDCDDEDTTNQTFKPNGKENDTEEYKF